VLVRKIVSCKGIKGDSRESDKRVNGLEVSLREGLVKFIYKFSHLNPIN